MGSGRTDGVMTNESNIFSSFLHSQNETDAVLPSTSDETESERD